MRVERCKKCGVELGCYVDESKAYCDRCNPNQSKLFESKVNRVVNTEGIDIPVCVDFGGQ